MTLCLVTNRQRLCAGTDVTPFDAARRCLVEQARLAVAAGIDLIHVRERDLETSQLQALVTDIVHVARGTATRIVVNDRLDVALACGADGVHLRGDSMPAAALRQIAPPGFLIGRSVHRLDEAATAGPVDYLIAGTVFPTASKSTDRSADGRVLGLDGLGQIVRSVHAPVLAIGGMTVDRAAAVRAVGAAGMAAIGLFVDRAGGAGCRTMPLGTVVEALRRKFDSLPSAS